ncbi:MAG: alpha/beta hydrolase [Burkholderiales bacterium]|nr:alpha/beta hydrolase [Burkholderiales bacterium]
MRLTVAGHETYAYTGARPLVPSQPTVVFVHGAAHDHSIWALQSRYFAHHGSNVLAVDLPGHGRSGGVPLANIGAIAAWLVALLDAAGVERAAFVGHSMGALACLEMAARYPARVRKVALLGPSVPMPVSDALLAAAKGDDHVAFELINAWSHSVPRQLGGNPVPGMWMTGAALRLMERSRPGVLHTDLAACHSYADGLDAAARVACPTLVILGERDLMAPARNARALLAALLDVRTVTLRGAGHALMTEQPDAVLDALRVFL